MTRFNDSARRSVSMLFASLLFTLLSVGAALAQTTAFTYQGRFTDTSVTQPTNGTYTVTFRLYDAVTDGNQIPNNTTSVTSMVSVVNNLFTTRLDFGAAAFNTTNARYLEIQVGSTVLTPRQEITSTPFANRATSAGAADSLSAACVGCVTNAQINSIDGAKVSGTVANASNAATATTAGDVSGVVAIANGGTGSTTQNFVDLITAQSVAGNKSLTGLTTLGGGARMQNLAADPEAASAANTGRVYYNTAIGSLRFSNGTAWVTAGQPVVHHNYATAGRLAVATTTLTVQSGLSRAIVVPAGFTANVVISANIGARNTQSTANLYSNIDFAVFLDNNLLPRGAYNRFSNINPGATGNSFTTSAINSAISVGAGTHTFEIRTSRSSGTVPVDIGGNAATDVNPGEMTLTVYYTPVTFNRAGSISESEESSPQMRR